MTIQTKQGNLEEKIAEQDVVDYLRQNPEFFESQLPLLTELSIPHITGGSSVSLVERQVHVLREGNKKLKKQLDDLIHIARDNDKLSRQINKMILEIMGEQDIRGLFSSLKQCLHRDFGADIISLRLMVKSDKIPLDDSAELVTNHAEMRKLFEKFLKDMRPMCGRMKQAQRDYLFQDNSSKVASVALLPISLKSKSIGLMAIGSYDEQRFRAGMGTVYLSHMCSFISKTLERYLASD